MYVDIFFDQKNNLMMTSERVDGKRVIKRHQPDFFLYYDDPTGVYRSTSGTKCSKFETSNYHTFKEELNTMQQIGRNTYEADVKPIFKALEQFYKGCTAPELNIALFDIEVDMDVTRGYSPPDEAFMPITAVSVYQTWSQELHTLVLKPKTLKEAEARQIVSKFDHTILCENEAQLLDKFLNLIDDADVFSGWNSGPYDVPYIVHRIQKVLGKPETARLSLWHQFPKKKEYKKYGEVVTSYEFTGRVHLDYLDLYRKYTYHELASYRLDYVGQIEVGETKTQYEGTLDQLYNNDFEKFIEYSRQDVELLRKIDEKNKYIELVSFIAHENLVPIPVVIGTVALSDNALLLEVHNRNMVMPSKFREWGEEEETEDNKSIAGGFVLAPIPGMYEWVASLDVTSLYPSTYRALNMSPETMVAQVRQDLTDKVMVEKQARSKKKLTNTEMWAGFFEVSEVTEIQNQTDTQLVLEYETGEKQNLSAKQIWDKVVKNNWILSANGTIFRTDIEGVIPSLLTRWFNDRLEQQAKLAELENLLSKATVKDEIEKLNQEIKFWDKRQQITKILLNAFYGATLNKGSRIFDQRLGQSCTLTGRCSTRHMMSKLNEILTGSYEIGSTLVAGDTDSAFFSIAPILDVLKQNGFECNKDSFLELANMLSDEVNTTFAKFLNDKFNIPLERGAFIKEVREVCATRAIWTGKKRYAVMVYDDKNKRKDKNGKVGAIKIKGMETQRADTPEWVQSKLEEILVLVLEHNDEERAVEFIKSMRKDFSELQPWQQGAPKRANNVKHYNDVIVFKNCKDENGKTITVPGHVRASINWNRLREANNDVTSIKITDGTKVVVCKLKTNPLGMTSIAYPIDTVHLPEWFLSMPFDSKLMVEGIIDQKVQNIIGVLNWDLNRAKESQSMETCFSW